MLKKKFGEMFKGLRKDSFICLLRPSLFLLNRICLCITIVFLQDYPVSSVCIVITTQYIFFLFNFIYNPFKKSYHWLLESFNELCVLIVASLMIIFTGAFDDIDLKVRTGYAVIGMILVNVIVNVLLVLIETIRNIKNGLVKLKNWCREWARRRKENRMMKKGT